MTDIKVLGPGCQRCNQLAAAAKLAADRLGIDYELEKIKDIGLYPSYGLMLTPGLVIDGELVSQGKLPTVDEIEALLGGGA
jgi:small redox-active disulfide protein 2